MKVKTEISVLEAEVARLLVEALNPEDIKPESMDPEAALFRDGLELDSIDVLEQALAISRKYGFKPRSDDQQNSASLCSLRALSQYVEQNRVQ